MRLRTWRLPAKPGERTIEITESVPDRGEARAMLRFEVELGEFDFPGPDRSLVHRPLAGFIARRLERMALLGLRAPLLGNAVEIPIADEAGTVFSITVPRVRYTDPEGRDLTAEIRSHRLTLTA